MNQPAITLLDAQGNPMRPSASFRGAGSGFGGQLRDWTPSKKTIDASLLPDLDLGNARAEDLTNNNGIASGAVQVHIDNIVGSNFRLSYKPRNKLLGMTDDDLSAFRADVEALWLEEAEDPDRCWLDVEEKRTFTMMVREVVGTHTVFNEAFAYAQWLTSANRPCRTALKLVSPKRVCNPNDAMDSASIRGGIRSNKSGAARSYFVRSLDASNTFGNGYGHKWQEINKRTRHGRLQFMHIFEPTEDGQTRAANNFLTVIEQLHMLPKLQQTKLQNAIVNAMYAATIETELGSEAAYEIIGAMTDNDDDKLKNYLTHLSDYHSNTNLKMNGVRIPHLLPQEKLRLQTSGNVDNGFSQLEDSILRWTARGLNVPTELITNNFTGNSYSGIRASLLEGWRYFMGRRKNIAARFGSLAFGLWLEEKVDRGHILLPRSARRGFYEAQNAWCNAEWIGSGRLAIDGLKEVKESILRIEAGLSTYEKELALMGEDYQETFQQQVHEMRQRKEAGLPPASWIRADQFAPDEMQEQAPPQLSDR